MSQERQPAKRRSRKTRGLHILTLAVATILFIFFFVPMVQLRSDDVTTDSPAAESAVAMENGRVFRQDLRTKPFMVLSSFGIHFGTFDRTNKGNLEVRFYENDTEISSWVIPTNELADDEIRDFDLETPITAKRGSVYYFTISDSYRGRNMISVWMNRHHPYGYYLDGEYQDEGSICFTQTYHYSKLVTTTVIIVAYVLMVAVILLLFFIYERRDRLSRFGGRLARTFDIRKPFGTTRVTVWDWIVFAILAGFCYFTMQHSDILHTGASSFALLRGHVLDFYEYNAKYLGGNAYMISTYLMFAIWNIPLAVLGLMGPPSMKQSYGVLMWFKGLPTFLFILSGIMFYKICKKCEEKSGISAKWGTFLFLLTPTAFYSQFMFGQYDALTVFFMVLALKVLFDERENSLEWCSFIFGIATTFKYHALLFFVPILLYKEKRVSRLVKNAILYVLPVLLVNLPYMHSAYFSSGVEDFGAVNYFFRAGIEYYGGDIWKIYLVPLLWVIVCVYAYTRKTAADFFDRFRDIAYATALVAWLAFGIVFWHPQWMMIATPFLVLPIIASNRRHVYCLVDLALTAAFMSFVESIFVGMTQGFYNLGLLSDLVYHRQMLSAYSWSTFCLLKDSNIAFTVISGLLLARALLIRPGWDVEKPACARSTEALWFRIRGVVGICILVVPMVICLISELHTPTFDASLNYDEETGIVTYEANTLAEFDNLTVAVWSEEGGQDDLYWYPVQKIGDNEWKVEVDLTAHDTLGMYYLHLYQYPKGVPTMINAYTFDVDALPEPEATDVQLAQAS